MLRWFLGTLGVLLIFGGIFGGGVYVGELRVRAELQGDAINTMRDEIKSAYARGAEDAERKAAHAADQQALKDWMQANAARRIDIGGELRRAIDAMDIGLCALSPDVQRVRQRAHQELLDAARPGR
jgi:hypothetical protein